MNRRLVAALLTVLMLLTMVSCKKKEESEVTTAGTVAETETTVIETTVDPIDLEGVVRETEPAVNKAAVIEKSETTEPTEDVDDSETKPNTKETEAATDPTVKVEVSIKGETEYEKLLEMSGSEQKEFMESFDSEDAFFEWLENAKEEYENETPVIEIGGDGIVNIGG